MTDPDAYEFGGFVLQPAQRRVLRGDGTSVELTPRLFSALLFFVEHPGDLLSKEVLLQSLWPGLVVEENNLSQVVAGLRRALGDDAQGRRFIQTVPRHGFRFVAPVTRPVALPRKIAPNESTAASPDPAPADTWHRRPLLLTLGAGAAVALGGAGWWASRHPLRVARSTATLAVLPFKPLAAEGRDELLELGMADSLISRLSTVPGLVVRSTGSVRQYAGPMQDPVRAARELEVSWIVDGSLQRRGEWLRTTARLLHAFDGVAAWSGSFDEKFTNVFDVQDQISNRVMQALLPVLHAGLGTPPRPLDIGGTRDKDAYQLYLAARWRAQGGRAREVEKGLALLNQAISIDPSYAMAWVELSQVHRRKLWNSDGLASEVFEPADAALRRALQLVPNLAEGHAGLGFSRFWFDFDWPGAEQAFRRALTLNPNTATAHWGLALLLLSQGRLADGFVHLRAARSLDPMSPVYNTLEAGLLCADGQLEAARMRLNRSLDISPDLWLTHLAAGLLHLAAQRPEQGIAAIRRAVALADGTTRPRSVLGVQLARLGEIEEVRSIQRQLLTESRERHVAPTTIASLHAALGEVEPALAALEQGFRLRETRMVFLKDDPHWTSLRAEPRFVALMKALKLDRYGPGLSPI
ncbi:winged helix-turn-helix domain-containing protein [Variovorax sp. J22P240]|uniref:winged helix-turn-helix domain-containing protein n=1 Tax=Variovorax sp. J22P240 TaxID=3053514 RepID=UPI002574B2CA|nr:winged helix-turn-helix domain-containing protein [Variovorax sp. J22P240]MDL9997544.1 winged helix-turn-helix domain-containing protein [Variovorax sp. J22P240]